MIRTRQLNDFLSTFLENEYIPYFNNITRPNVNFGLWIDNMFVKSKLNNIKSLTYQQVFADHYPIFLTERAQPTQMLSEPQKTIKYNKLLINCEKSDWADILNMHY